MDYAVFVQKVNGHDYLSDIEASCLLIKCLVRLHHLIQLPTWYEWHDKIKPQVSLKTVVHATQERMLNLK